jgi:hypothetical protein
MTGGISKHNYLRAIGVAEDLQKLLLKSGIVVDKAGHLFLLLSVISPCPKLRCPSISKGNRFFIF